MQPSFGSASEWNDPPENMTQAPKSRRAYHAISSEKSKHTVQNQEPAATSVQYSTPNPNTQQPGFDRYPTTIYAEKPTKTGEMPHPTNLVVLTIPSDPVALYSPPTSQLQSDNIVKYCRSTLNVVPGTQGLLNRTKLPFGIIITPYPYPELYVPTVTGMILRCKQCRTYINVFSEQIQRNKYKCNLCFMINDIPHDYDYDSIQQKPVDRNSHPELNHSVVEFVAPSEYMSRPPQANGYLFLIDISYSAIKSGMVATTSRVILDSLDYIPNKDGRTNMGFILFDKALHFVSLSHVLDEPQLLVVGELDEIYLPRPDNLLVNLVEHRVLIEKFLQKLPSLFLSTQTSSNILGTALKAAYSLLSSLGGKVVVLQSTLPNSGEGTLKNREDPSVYGTAKESALIRPDNQFYKNFAMECYQKYICVDLFLFPSGYIDIASMSMISRFTGGQVFYYPGFTATNAEDATRFSTEFSQFLSKKFGLEAVLRIRASKGVTINSYHGNFFTRQTDLLGLANVNPDHSYAVDLSIETNIGYPVVSIQTALLYTNSDGERRIRVMTLALPVTLDPGQIYSNADAEAIACLYSKLAIDIAENSKLENARDFLFSKCVDVFSAQKSILGPTVSAHLVSTEFLRPLPSLLFGATKSLGFRSSIQTPSDFRSYFFGLLRTCSVDRSTIVFYPNFYSLHNLPDQCGVQGQNGLADVLLPWPMTPTSEVMERGGLYLIDNGMDLYLWISSSLSSSICKELFGTHFESIPVGKHGLPELSTPFSIRVRSIIAKIRWIHNFYSSFYIVREDSDIAMRKAFLSLLIEDRVEDLPSYAQWLTQIRQIVSGAAAG